MLVHEWSFFSMEPNAHQCLEYIDAWLQNKDLWAEDETKLSEHKRTGFDG